MVLEQEKTYLLKQIPDGLALCESSVIIDLYIPAEEEHPCMRLRSKDGVYELTKKVAADDHDLSKLYEYNTPLSAQEFNFFAQLPSKRIAKRRYKYPYQGLVLEIDVFQEEHTGLVLCEAEFASQASFDAFKMPDFCLADITQDSRIAGGLLSGKTIDQVMVLLQAYGYKPLFVDTI